MMRKLQDHESRIGALERKVMPVTAAPAGAVRADSYTVRKGDTLSSIASRHRVALSTLMAANGLSTRSVLRPGQRLKMPAGAPAAKPATTPAVTSAKKAAAGSAKPAAAAPSAAAYRVQPGDTVHHLARRFGISEKELMALNGLKDARHLRAGVRLRLPVSASLSATPVIGAPPAVAPPPPVSPDPLPAGWQWHEVRRGESLSQIAARHQTSRQAIEQANDLDATDVLQAGKLLKIPPPERPVARSLRRRAPAAAGHPLNYQVRPGDTPESLARDLDADVEAIRALNRLSPGEALVPGRRILVPGAGLFAGAAAAH